MVAIVHAREKSPKVFFCGDAAVCEQLFIKALRALLRQKRGERPRERVILLLVRLRPRVRRASRVHAELRPPRAVRDRMERVEEAVRWVADETAQAADLIGDERIHRVHHERADAAHAPRRRPLARLARELREERPEEAFGLAGARARRDEEVAPFCRRLEGLDLMAERRRIDAEVLFLERGKERLEPRGKVGMRDAVRHGLIGRRGLDVWRLVEDALVIEATFQCLDEHRRLREILRDEIMLELLAQFFLHLIGSIRHKDASFDSTNERPSAS